MALALPDFILKMTGHAERVEAHLKAVAELETAKARIVALETELANLKAGSADGPVKITELTGQVNRLTTSLTESNAALETMRATLATRDAELAAAKGAANAVIAGQGLATSALPALDPNPNPAAGTQADDNSGTLTEQCLRAKSKKAAKK